jgi:hypothetical protein
MEEERDDLDNCMLELVDLMLEDQQEVKCDKIWKTETAGREIPGKRNNQRSKTRRLYMKKINQ